jgi:hypothetical protein
MEIALVISSLAGAATAATINKFPKKKIPLIGANSHIRTQIDTLRIEKEILTKTISRLYTDGTDLTKIQRDKLLLRYQHQLGVILAKIEKLEQASKHPDLGPLGDGLITLMDQKLSALDGKLAEISSKITAAQAQLEKQQVEPKQEVKPTVQKVQEKPEIIESPSIEEIIKSFAKPTKRLEITTLTEIPSTVEKPTIETPIQHPQTREEFVQQVTEEPLEEEIVEQVNQTVQPQVQQVKPFITEPIDIEKQVRSEPPKLEFRESKEERKKPKLNIPEPETVDEGEDDLDSIKREIMKTLSKLEQAEVE